MKRSPCETCGACCAFFFVTFPDTETSNTIGGLVPIDMTSKLSSSRCFMKGTNARYPRCIALEGKVGCHVKCLIYENRPSACRDFKLSWENNRGNFLCDQSREFFGLQAFSKY